MVRAAENATSSAFGLEKLTEHRAFNVACTLMRAFYFGLIGLWRNGRAISVKERKKSRRPPMTCAIRRPLNPRHAVGYENKYGNYFLRRQPWGSWIPVAA